MDTSRNFHVRFDPGWEMVKQIREKVESFVVDIDSELAYASKMVASELIENAIKYGISVDHLKGVNFELEMKDDQIRIMVSNGVKYDQDAMNVKEYLGMIQAAKDPKDLYIQRLSELLENPKSEKTQLGLFRIAYEGEFKLEHTYENRVLSVIATRPVKK